MKGLFAYNRLDEGERQHRPCYVVRQTENDVAQTTHKIPLTKTLSKQHNLYLQKTHYPGENVYEFPVSENEVSNVYHFIKNRYARRNATFETVPGTTYDYLKHTLRLQLL